MSNLVRHAERELALAREDEQVVAATLEIVAVFARVGHSGTSAHFHRQMIHRLLAFEHLTPLTDNPGEWVEVGHGMWQNVRNSEAFSEDGGKTYYLLSERRRRRWPFKGWSKPTHTSQPALAADVSQEVTP